MANPLGPGLLTLGEAGSLRQFAANTTATYLEPSYSDGDVVDFLDGSSDTEVDEETWTLQGTVRQDLTATGALEDWCLENAGQMVPFTFTPVADEGKSYTGQCKVRAIRIGGDVKAKNTSDFSFPVKGKPTITTGA